MFAINRILVPVDFSARSAGAVKYAVALKSRCRAELTCLHIAGSDDAPADGANACLSPAYALAAAWNDMKLTEAKQRMTEFLRSEIGGVAVTPCVRSGEAAKIIVQQAHTSKVDLIVLATHGFGGFRRMLLGSTTAKVLHDANCPVLTCSHVETIPAVIPPFRNVLCAVDYGPQSEKVLRWADGFARAMESRLVVANVLPVIASGQWGYCEADVDATLRKDAEEKGRSLIDGAEARAELVLETGGVVETLKHLVERERADILVIGRHHQGGLAGRLRDRAYAIIRESPCPVVSV